MNRFRSCLSKPRHYCKPNGIFEEDFFRWDLRFLGIRGFSTGGRAYLKQAARFPIHWRRDHLNCDSYGCFKNIAWAYQRNFIQKRLLHKIKKAVNVKEGISRKGRVSSDKISNTAISCQQPGDKEKRKIPILSVEPSFGQLLENVLNDIDESMCDFDSNKSDDTQLVDEINEYLDLKDDFHLPYEKIHRNTKLDLNLKREFMDQSNNENVINMRKFTRQLPCFKFQNSFLDLLANNQIVVVTGSTGSGKSSQLVQYVLNDYILSSKGSLCNIVCIVPRRVCAIALAERIAAERGENVGKSIGYQVRFQSMLSKLKRGCINFMTTGVFLNHWKNEDYIDSLSHIFIDEVHERSIDCDLILALMKVTMQKRPELKIVLLSATTNVDLLCTYMNGASHLEIAGVTYPVEEYYLEDILKKTRYVFKKEKNTIADNIFYDNVLPYVKKIEATGSYPKYVTREMAKPNSEVLDKEFIVDTINYIIENEEAGCILVFLPGLHDIISLEELIKLKPWYSQREHMILRMHSVLNAEEQKRIFIRPSKGFWKIIISTSILETSVTVDDIKYIIDSGKVKAANYDAVRKLHSVDETWISKSNAVQRKGRAGRVQKGKCFKLYSRAREESFPKFPPPEFLHANLEETYLKVKSVNIGCVESFLDTVVDPPRKEVVLDSVKSLKEIGALDSEQELSPLGRVLINLPTSPQIGKLLLMGAVFGCSGPISSIAACLSLKSPFLPASGEYGNVLNNIKKGFDRGDNSDHLIFSRIMDEWKNAENRNFFCLDNGLSRNGMSSISHMKNQFERVLRTLKFLGKAGLDHSSNNLNSNNTKLLKAVLCAGFYPNYTVIREKNSKGGVTLNTPNRKLMLFHSKSYCKRVKHFESPYFVYYVKIMASILFVHDASMVDILPMILFAGRVSVRERNDVCFVKINEMITVGMPMEIALQLMASQEEFENFYVLGDEVRNRLNMIFDAILQDPEKLSLFHEKVLPSFVQLLSSNISLTYE